MIQVKLVLPTGRRNCTTTSNQVLRDFLEDEDVVFDGCTVSVNGMPCGVIDFNATFEELGATDTVVVAVVEKHNNA